MPLSSRDARRLRSCGAAADLARSLQPRQQALIHRRDWLRLLAPREAGGAEWPLPRLVRLEEALAQADGSTGWVVTLCAGAGWFTGFLPPPLAQAVLATPRVCLAGSGAPSGRAEREGAGWRLQGHWAFATGAPLATHFTLNAVLHEDGQPLREADGRPRVCAFLVEAAAVRVVPAWRSLGLRASGTHAFAIDGVWLPQAQAFEIRPEAATFAGPLWRFPFDALAWATLAANVGGMARAFLEEAGEVLRERPGLAERLAPQAQRLAAVRATALQSLDTAWDAVAAGRLLGPEDRQALQRACAGWVRTAREAVDEVYPACGLWAAHEDSTLNRLWRDLHTATQHALLSPV